MNRREFLTRSLGLAVGVAAAEIIPPAVAALAQSYPPDKGPELSYAVRDEAYSLLAGPPYLRGQDSSVFAYPRVPEAPLANRIQNHKDHVVREARFMGEKLGVTDVQDLGADRVYAFGRTYDLGNLTDRVFAGAVIEAELADRTSRDKYGNAWYTMLPRDAGARTRIDRLYGTVKFADEDKHKNIAPAALVQLQPVFETLREQGLDVPTQLATADNYFEAASRANHDTMIFTGRRPVEGLGIYYAVRNPGYVANYKKVLANNMHEINYTRTHLWPNHMGPPRDDVEWLQSLGSSFADHMTGGQAMRNLELWARETGEKDIEELVRGERELHKKYLKGLETTAAGKRRMDFDPSMGKAVVNDYSKEWDPGVILKPEPRFDLDPEWPAVYDGAQLQLLAAPRVIVDRRAALKMYPVEDLTTGSIGWIPEQFLATPKG